MLQYCFNSHRDHYSTSRHTTSNLLYDASRQQKSPRWREPFAALHIGTDSDLWIL